MKKDIILSIFASLVVSAVSITARAQDTLVLQDRKELYVKVIEIGDNKISYRKSDNLNGPLYSCSLRDVFMAIYRGGRREMFDAPVLHNAGAAPNSHEPPPPVNLVMTDETFRLVLKQIGNTGYRKNYDAVSGEVDVFTGNDFFATVSFVAMQRKDTRLDFSHPRPAHAGKSGISMQISSKQLSEYLFEKYENSAGSGLGWVLPYGFLTGEGCQVAYLKKPRQTDTDVAWLQGKLDFEKYDLKSCASVEEKMLSIVLLWLKKNFGAQK